MLPLLSFFFSLNSTLSNSRAFSLKVFAAKYLLGGGCDLGRKWRHGVFIEKMSFQVTAEDMEGRIITQFVGLVLMCS